MTHKKILVYFIALLPLFVVSCSSDDDTLIGKWYSANDFEGLARSGASSFTIGDKGYLVCGYDGKKRLSDTWEYNIDGDYWTQKADFPGTPRNAGVGLAVGSKGYFGTGYDGENYLGDFWEFDPSANTWTQKADFPGTARYSAVAFGLQKGYVGCGYDGNYLKDMYAYTPSTNTWEKIVSLGGTKRMGATSFIINNMAYIVGGMNNSTYVEDFWKFDESTGTWTQLRDIADTSDDDYDDDYSIVRQNGVAFVIDGSAYFTCGESGSVRNDVWKYYPSTDLWEEVHAFSHSGTSKARTETCAFSTGSRGFVVTGRSSTYRYDDMWEFHPTEYDDDDN